MSSSRPSWWLSSPSTAKLRPLFDAASAEPEPGYVRSAKPAEFVRCRDLTCRAPGCDVPAVYCDVDHTIPWSEGGLTHASNLKCYCRKHHLCKTFWGWRDKQLPDGTVILTLPDGQTYVTTPGSALLFPSLYQSTGELPAPEEATGDDRCGERTSMMPKRRRTRSQNRSQRVAAERRQNHDARQSRRRASTVFYDGLLTPTEGDGEPPPF